MRRIASLCLSLFVGFVAFSAAQDVTKPINGGVLNGKAVSLPKPPYPPAARAVGASGAVTIQVLIDENGDVVSATAVSGHPLLRAAAVEAARSAKFAPTRLSGTPIKVAGVITYNFVGPMHLARISFILSNAERTSSFGAYSTPESLAFHLPADWIQEKEILGSLTFEERPRGGAKAERKQDVASPPPPPDAARYTIKGEPVFSAVASPSYGARRLDAKSVASVQNLSSLLEVRASINPLAAWTYEVGKALGILVSDIDDRVKLQSALDTLESISERAPSGAGENSLRQLKEFLEFAKNQNLSDDDRQLVRARAEMLSNLRY